MVCFEIYSSRLRRSCLGVTNIKLVFYDVGPASAKETSDPYNRFIACCKSQLNSLALGKDCCEQIPQQLRFSLAIRLFIMYLKEC